MKHNRIPTGPALLRFGIGWLILLLVGAVGVIRKPDNPGDSYFEFQSEHGWAYPDTLKSPPSGHSPSPESAPPRGLSSSDWSAIRQQIRAAEYHFSADPNRPAEKSFNGFNPAQNFRLFFGSAGIKVTPVAAAPAHAPLPAAGDRPVAAVVKPWLEQPTTSATVSRPRLRTRARAGAAPSVSPPASNGSWDWKLQLTGFGYEGDVHPALEAIPKARGKRMELHHGDLVEWYVNEKRGVEHGFTIPSPPDYDGASNWSQVNVPLRVEMALNSSLKPELVGLNLEDQVIRFRNEQGTTILGYHSLQVFDATGRELPAHFELARDDSESIASREQSNLARGANRLAIVVDDHNAAYPIMIDPLLTSEVAKLTASDAAEFDQFGWSVAISGDTVVVGAFSDDDNGSRSGSAYILERNQGGVDNWGEVKKLTASDAAEGDFFGYSVGISGDTVVVSALLDDAFTGSAYVFERNVGGADNWGEMKKLTASDAAADDQFGRSAAISGDTVVVGAYFKDDVGSNSGAAYLFERNVGGADNWGEMKKLTASDAAGGDNFGNSVAISSDTVVVGANRDDDDGSSSGSAYLFERNVGGADNWGEVKKLSASDAAQGDVFGSSVAISGDTAVVGAENKADVGFQSGAAYLFERNTGGADNWGEVKKLSAFDADATDVFGNSVAVNGNTIVVGALLDNDDGADSGSAYIFVGSGGDRADALTTIDTSPDPSVGLQPVDVMITVTEDPPGNGAPTGTVTLKVGSTILGSASLSGGTAMFTTSLIPVGIQNLMVYYSGDATFNATISVEPHTVQPSSPPVANADSAATARDVVLNVAAGAGGVLDNDTDPDSDAGDMPTASALRATVSPRDDKLRLLGASFATATETAITLDGFTVDKATGLALHPQTGVTYAILEVNNGAHRRLVMLDLLTGVATDIGDLGDFFAGLAFDGNGVLYGVTGGERQHRRNSVYDQSQRRLHHPRHRSRQWR